MNALSFPIIYEDNHLLVVDKPAGMLTQPSPQESHSLETLCKQWLKEKYQKKGNVFLVAIHRLDKPVSGIVVFAKSSKALSRLNESMRNGLFHKTYVATVEGKMPANEGTLEHFLVHDEHNHKAVVVKSSTPHAKLAKLHYKVLETKADGTQIVSINLETGRYHQIRAQCAAIGAPILGDSKYGSNKSLNSTIALRHSHIQFPHPVNQLKMDF